MEEQNGKNSEGGITEMGFEFIAAYMYITDDKGNAIFRYGNIGLKLLSDTEVKLFEFKND